MGFVLEPHLIQLSQGDKKKNNVHHEALASAAHSYGTSRFVYRVPVFHGADFRAWSQTTLSLNQQDCHRSGQRMKFNPLTEKSAEMAQPCAGPWVRFDQILLVAFEHLPD
jgi:hypothetical protein